jgi:hypothetical protein
MLQVGATGIEEEEEEEEEEKDFLLNFQEYPIRYYERAYIIN